MIAEAKADGLPVERSCKVLGLSQRTVQRWKAPLQPLPTLVAPPLTVRRARPYNAITASEAATVIALIRSPKHADSSCRDLALALQTGPRPTYVSHVTIWQNQLWDWDITYLHTQEPYVFLYLYSLLDHWSRKNIAWHISTRLISDEAQTLWDHGLINEGLLDQPAHNWPKSLSDRGTQMRSHSTTTYFRKLGIPQLFSRPRTPNDNPYIESHFATIKTHPFFPGYFAGQAEAESYFDQFYPWYNDVHPHTRLNMLTPHQVHSGQGPSLEELIANHLPDVSDYPCYSWMGPKTAPVKKATPLD
jgi:transposase InsO family protein